MTLKPMSNKDMFSTKVKTQWSTGDAKQSQHYGNTVLQTAQFQNHAECKHTIFHS